VADKPRRTGLGANVFFQPPPPVAQPPTEPFSVQQAAPALHVQPPVPVGETPPASSPQNIAPRKQEQPAKVRTTINLGTDTLALLDALKVHARKNRRKATYSDILDEAIRELAKKKSIQT
jgi:hypothetical protein